MQDAQSYVYGGRDNTGAASVLKPMNAENVFAYYDKQRLPKKNPILDSLGQDILDLPTKAMKEDRPYINSMIKKYVDEMSRLRASGKTLESDPDAYTNIISIKGELTDWVSKSQRDEAAIRKFEEDRVRNPDLYEDNFDEQIVQYRNTPLEKRSSEVPVRRLRSEDFSKYIQSIGDPYGYRNVRNADGSFSNVVYFDPAKAEKSYEATKAASGGNAGPFRRYLKTQEELAKSKAIANGINYDALSVYDKAALTDQQAKETWIEIKRNQKKVGGAFGATPLDKTTGSKTGKAVTKPEDNVSVFWSGVPVDEKGNRIKAGEVMYEGEGDDKVEVPKTGSKMKVLKRVSWNIGNRETGNKTENQLMIWEGGQEGIPQRIDMYEGEKPVLIVYDSKLGQGGSEQEVPLTPANAKKLLTDYNIDIDVLKNSKKFKDLYSKLKGVSELKIEDFVDIKKGVLNETTKKQLEDAITERMGGNKVVSKPASPSNKPTDTGKKSKRQAWLDKTKRGQQ